MSHIKEIFLQKERPVLSRLYVDKHGFKIGTEYEPGLWHFVLVFGLFVVLTFSRLGSPSIYILDEARNAQCAREMMQHHTLVVSTFNETLRADKPPLHYFFMMAAYKMFGVSSFSARFFSAIMGLLTLAAVALFVSKFLNKTAAFLSVIVLLCSSHFLFEFRLAVPDPYFIFFITSGLMSGFAWLKKNDTRFLYLSAVLLALATLAKGPLALALPAVCLLVFAFFKKNLKYLFTWHLVPALVLYLSIAVPWYVAVHGATGGAWTNAFFLEHNLDRFSSSREGHSGFFLLPLLIALIGLLPFSAFVAEVFKNRRPLFSNDILVFSLIVFAVVIIFFSLSATKLPQYTMIAYPFAAIILGYYLNKVLRGEVQLRRYPIWIISAVFSVVPLVIYFVLKLEPQTTGVAVVAAIFILPSIMLLMVAIKQGRLNSKSRIYSLTASFLVFNLVMFNMAYPLVYANNPVAKTLSKVRSASAVAAYQHYNPAYNFYLEKAVPKLSKKQIDSVARYAPETIILTSSSDAKELDYLKLNLVAKEHDIFEGRETIILSPFKNLPAQNYADESATKIADTQ